jgi:hypothetical protein
VVASAAEPLGRGGEGASRGIAEGAQRGQKRRQEDVNLLIRFALAHAEPAFLDRLQRVRLYIDQNKQRSVF